MKPQLLKVSGLNSFVQEEVVDFRKLVSRGLFGIFGPTGSGKSSILDAITIALYGEIARDTKEFINKETGELYVYFEFTIGSRDLLYIVDRKLKLNDNNGYSTAFARFVIKEDSRTIEVYEGVREVRDKVEEVIGLNHEDFMRTVVLPQGQFSRFLKLKGRERRDMLERILKLEEYGENLMEKLRIRRNRKRNQLKGIETFLANYEDITKERLEQEKNNLVVVNEEIKAKRNVLNLKRKEYEDAKEVWQLQNQLQTYQGKLEILTEREREITDLKNRLEKTRKALNIKTEILRYERYQQDYHQVSQKQMMLIKEIDQLQKKVMDLEEQYEKNLLFKEEKLPELAREKADTETAWKLFNENQILKEELLQKQEQLKEMSVEKEKLQELFSNLKENSAEIAEEITLLEENMEEYTITAAYREKITRGFAVENDYLLTKEQLAKVTEQIRDLQKDLNEQEAELTLLQKDLKECESGILNKYKQLINGLIDNKQWLENKRRVLQDDIKESKERLKQLTAMEEELKINYMASILARELKEGLPCPVCGSTEHPQVVKETDSNLSFSGEEKRKLEEGLQELHQRDSEYQTQLSLVTRDLERLQEEKALFQQDLSFDIAGEEDLSQVEIKGDLSFLKKKRENLKTQLIKIRTSLEGCRADIERLKKEEEGVRKRYNKLKKAYNEAVGELKIESFSALLEEVRFKDQTREEMQSSVKRLRLELAANNSKIEGVQQKLQELEKDIASLTQQLEVINERYRKNSQEISEKVGERDPGKYLEELKAQEEKIKKEVVLQKENLDKITALLNEKNGDKKAIEQSLQNLEQEIAATGEYLQTKVAEYHFADYQEAKEYLENEREVAAWEKQLAEFEEEKKIITNNLDRISAELNNRSINEEEWKELQRVKDELEKELQLLQERLGSQKTTINQLERELKVKEKYLLEKKKLEHELALLAEIDDLIRGKSFVEFVAMRQLRYIAREASRRLMAMTNNRYMLEVDNQGEFVISDKYNGGICRDCNTLSGGETFLTSLALALALSSQIQLKGNTSMEFFFLDEGFGTLDSNLLDLVMNSLEGLQAENLAVGIISHVEELKNRVPVKLLVEPACPGLRGSRVRIEYT